MQITYKGTNYDITPDIRAYAEKKLAAIDKFVGNETDTETELYVELGRETGAHQHGRVWRVEFNLDKDGNRYRATATEESLEAAIDKAIPELSRTLSTAKNKKQGFVKRGGAAIKSMLRGFGG